MSGDATLTAEVAQILSSCGLSMSAPRTPATTDELVVHIGHVGAVDVHRWMTTGTAHLVISPRAATVRVGPLVQPGTTACLQCLHLARSERDPSWPWVSERLSRTPCPRPDPLVVLHAGVLAARAAIGWAEQGHNVLAGSYWVVDLDDPTTASRAVTRHPQCGCWWPLLSDPEGQLGGGQAPADPPVV